MGSWHGFIGGPSGSKADILCSLLLVSIDVASYTNWPCSRSSEIRICVAYIYSILVPSSTFRCHNSQLEVVWPLPLLVWW